jgi:recombinational DNA repair protein (RecF pathway)
VGVCTRCDKELGREKVAFSPSYGGTVCTDCGDAPTDSLWVPAAASSYVRAVRCAEPHKLKDMKIPKGARRDLARMLKWHIRYRLERELKSVGFIDAIAGFEDEGTLI